MSHTPVTPLLRALARDLGPLAELPAALGPEYSSLPYAVTDAVFSIGVRYEGVQRVVERVATWCGVAATNEHRPTFSPAARQLDLDTFLARLNIYPEAVVLAQTFFGSRQRTSTRSGILKAEAVRAWSELLVERGVTLLNLDTVATLREDTMLRDRLRLVAGQGSGISLTYLQMLCGDEQLVKPDRVLLDYLRVVTRQDVSPNYAQELLVAACAALRAEGIETTPNVLDRRIWEFHRQRTYAVALDE